MKYLNPSRSNNSSNTPLLMVLLLLMLGALTCERSDVLPTPEGSRTYQITVDDYGYHPAIVEATLPIPSKAR